MAYYRMGNFAAAEEMFRQSTRPEVASSAAYNLGNTLVQQNKLQESVTAYEDVLKKWPDHKQAKDNLELVKKMLEQQEQQEDQDADLWLNQIKNDPKSFLKNKFYLESTKNGTKEEVDPW